MEEKTERKVYRGERDKNGRCIVTVNGKPLPNRIDLFDYSSEFEWGYAGNGPAQLALALLADLLGDDIKALQLHQLFTNEFVSSIPKTQRQWVVKDDWLRKIVQAIDKGNK